MNRPLLNKILIGGLLAIWTAVGYKFFKPAKDSPSEQLEQVPMIAKTEGETLPDFEWEPLKRDPFLNTITRSKTAPKKSKPSGGRLTRPKNTSTIWPTIEYFGFVQRNNQPAPLALIKINDVLYRLRVGESYQIYALDKVTKDSIIMSYGSSRKIFHKTKL